MTLLDFAIQSHQCQSPISYYRLHQHVFLAVQRRLVVGKDLVKVFANQLKDISRALFLDNSQRYLLC